MTKWPKCAIINNVVNSKITLKHWRNNIKIYNMSETNEAINEILKIEAERAKAQELTKDMQESGANVKDVSEEALKRAKELEEVKNELNDLLGEEKSA